MYIGRSLTAGNYLKLDDLSSQFNGTKKTFNLTSGGNPYYPGSAFSILVSLGGVVQEPDSAYQIDQNTITFAAAPQSTDDFFCISLGEALAIGVPGDGTVSGEKLTRPFNYDSGLLYLDDTNNRVGINSLAPGYSLDVNGSINFTGTFYQNGSQFVASRWTAGAGTTIYRNSSVGIGTTNPATGFKLDVVGGKVRVDNVTNSSLEFWNGASFYGGIGVAPAFGGSGTDIILRADVNRSLIFQTGGANERARFDTSGNFVIGTTVSTGTGAQPLQVGSATTVLGAYISGSVGIGNTNPLFNLHTYGPSAGAGATIAQFDNSTGGIRISIVDETTATSKPPGIRSRNASLGLGLYAQAGPLIIYNNATDVERVRIDNAGNLGINSTAPTSRLDVVGNAEISGSVGVNTSSIATPGLTGVGNSFNGVYVSNGMMIMDNKLTGNHYIGTAYNGLMAGPVDVQGTLTVDGVWVVV